jgi:copper homeostasis protein
MLLEVIVQSLDDARAALEGGADRLEVVRAIEDGGLTPSIELVHEIAAHVGLPLRVMVRENAGYRIDAGELDRLQRAAYAFEAANVDGIVLGFADPDGVRMADVVSVLADAPRVAVTFHRAFDSLRDPIEAIPLVAACPQVDRLLTSGGNGSPDERADRLHRYSKAAGARLTIIAGGGVDEASIRTFVRTQCVQEIHVGRAARTDSQSSAAVNAKRVAALRKLVDASG